jgi:hypothetical protein
MKESRAFVLAVIVSVTLLSPALAGQASTVDAQRSAETGWH